jgi:hypothetical protein
LTVADYDMEPGWHAVFIGARIAQMKVLQARETAKELRARIVAHLAGESEPELADILVVAAPRDLDPIRQVVPPHVTAFLDYVWSGS